MSKQGDAHQGSWLWRMPSSTVAEIETLAAELGTTRTKLMPLIMAQGMAVLRTVDRPGLTAGQALRQIDELQAKRFEAALREPQTLPNEQQPAPEQLAGQTMSHQVEPKEAESVPSQPEEDEDEPARTDSEDDELEDLLRVFAGCAEW